MITLDTIPAPLCNTGIAVATTGDRVALLATLHAAFEDDPVTRWFFPGEIHDSCFPLFADAFGGSAFTHSSAYYVSNYEGAALWLPPEIGPDEERMMDLIDRNLEVEKRGTAFAVFEQMALHHPHEPHWYLPLIGVKPPYQGRGHGGALLARVLEKCDEAGVAAYLESSNPRNLSLYHRHGFEIAGEIRIGSCPPIVPMIRTPRR